MAGAGQLVLVVEDAEPVRTLVSRLLEDAGTASSPRRAARCSTCPATPATCCGDHGVMADGQRLRGKPFEARTLLLAVRRALARRA